MEKIKFEKSYNDGCGTSLQGYIHASYHELVEMFGEPQWQESGDGKCTFTFVIDYVIQSADGDDEDYGEEGVDVIEEMASLSYEDDDPIYDADYTGAAPYHEDGEPYYR